MSIQIVIGSDAAAPACGSASPSTWLARRLRQMVAAVLLQRAIRRAEADLMALSDRTLKDIGLSRGEIRRASTSCAGSAGAPRPSRARSMPSPTRSAPGW